MGLNARAAVTLSLLALVGAGCGARAADDAGDALDGPPNEAAAGAAGRDGLEPAGPVDTRTLPECEPGLPRSSGECRFVFEGLCYATVRAACACACPRGGESRCIIGGFLSPDEPERVTCIGS